MEKCICDPKRRHDQQRLNPYCKASHADDGHLVIKARALQIWNAMNDSEKHGVHFALFPAEPMTVAEKEGYDGHKLVVALMEIAKENPPRQAPYSPKSTIVERRR